MNEMIYSRQDIEKALQLAEYDAQAAQQMMIPRPRGIRPPGMTDSPRKGAVLVLLYHKEERTHLVLTRRRDDLNVHAGQISFPGGRREKGERLQATALREAQEEVGVDPAAMAVLGRLACLYIPPTDYEVYPFVAWHNGQPDFKLQAEEVAEILEVPLSLLLDPATRHEEPWEIQGYHVEVPYYLVDGHKVWGATAMMLSDFLERLRLI